MEESLKYTSTSGKDNKSFFFDHVHIAWNNQITLHQQDSWELSYVITGQGVRAIGDMVEPFSEGEVIMIPPNIPHCWTFDETVHDKEGKIENITLTFFNEQLDIFAKSFPELSGCISALLKHPDAISFKGEIRSRIQQILLAMTAETEPERLSSFIRLLTLMSSSEKGIVVGHPTVNDKKNRKMQDIYLYVMNNYQHAITLDEVARFAGMEKSSFCVFFKKMHHKSFFSFLTDYRIECSCQMLLKTSKSIAEICLTSGFRDVPYYNRVFKRIKKMTPTEFREQTRLTSE